MIDPRDLYVFFTMDCERVCDRDLSMHGIWGPPDWAFSERSIRRFDQILCEEGLIGTYFIVPDTAEAHPALWAELTARGSELGLHLHPQGFGDLRWDRFLPEYDESARIELLREAMDVWQRALGRRPTVFRPGNFSGNVALFPTLLRAGLIGGSVALPGRVRQDFRANWADLGASCRFLPDDADRAAAFLEVPVSASASRFVGTDDHRDPLHLRVEAQTMDTDLFREVVVENLTCRLPDPSFPRSLVVMTHNTPDYTEDRWERRLRDLIRIIRSCAEAHGMCLVNTTIERLRQMLLS